MSDPANDTKICDACNKAGHASGFSRQHQQDLCWDCQMAERSEYCASCGRMHEREYSIHRDGFCFGPQVPLCNACGAHETPTCEELWKRIAERLKVN